MLGAFAFETELHFCSFSALQCSTSGIKETIEQREMFFIPIDEMVAPWQTQHLHGKHFEEIGPSSLCKVHVPVQRRQKQHRSADPTQKEGERHILGRHHRQQKGRKKKKVHQGSG